MTDPFKAAFLRHLGTEIFCRIGISPISGVGVIAIRDIPANTDPFLCTPPKGDHFIDISEQELSEMNPSIQQYIKDFFSKDEQGAYPVNATGLNDLNISFFVNHSATPNLKIEDVKVENDTEKVNSLNTFLTNRNINAEEELTCDYREFLSVNILKEQFPFLSEHDETSI
tara:strand:- start:742 stop:1251 length:510 start_codon:yes stop_codon:yes gene_type:complete